MFGSINYDRVYALAGKNWDHYCNNENPFKSKYEEQLKNGDEMLIDFRKTEHLWRRKHFRYE